MPLTEFHEEFVVVPTLPYMSFINCVVLCNLCVIKDGRFS
jgi:hypothetical protein